MKRSLDGVRSQTTLRHPAGEARTAIPHGHATVLLKLEFFNPFSSVKDRIGRAMIEAAEKAGILSRRPKSSSPPAATRASPGVRGRRQGLQADADDARVDEPGTPGMLRALGANLVLTPAKDGMKGAIAKAQGTGRRDAQQLGSRSSSTTRPIRPSTSEPPARRFGRIPPDGSM
jgi:hypothetical protein